MVLVLMGLTLHHAASLLKVFLLPAALARKRIWNPKYPICIQLGAEEDGTGSEQNLGSDPAQTSSTQPCAAAPALYLFGRTGREKEEWFRHLLLASAVPDGPSPSRWSTRPGNKRPGNKRLQFWTEREQKVSWEIILMSKCCRG